MTFTVEGEPPDKAMGCNCSHCRRKGFLLAFVAADDFTLTAGEDALSEYRFNKHKLAHRFCATCGCQPFATGSGPGDKAMAAVNLRCVPAVDLDALTIEKIDGASF